MRQLRKHDRVPSLDVLEMAMERGYVDGTQYPHTYEYDYHCHLRPHCVAPWATLLPGSSILTRTQQITGFPTHDVLNALPCTPLNPLPNEHDSRSAN